MAAYVADTAVAMLSVDHRLAPEYPHPTPVEDCFAALSWLHAKGARLGVDPTRIGTADVPAAAAPARAEDLSGAADAYIEVKV